MKLANYLLEISKKLYPKYRTLEKKSILMVPLPNVYKEIKMFKN